jgi:hypothetical protein
VIEPKFGPWGPNPTQKGGSVWGYFLDLSLNPKLDQFFVHTNPIVDPEGPPNPIFEPWGQSDLTHLGVGLCSLYSLNMNRSMFEVGVLHTTINDLKHKLYIPNTP